MAESPENLLTHIPYPELYAPEAVKAQIARNILLQPQSENDDKKVVSPIDLRRTPQELSGQEMLDAVSNHLGVSLGKVNVTPSSADERHALENQLLNINAALRGSHDYLRRVLNVKVPEFEVR